MFSQFSEKELAQKLASKISSLLGERELTVMHVCGTHEASIARYGLRHILPRNLHVVMGPGCPVCITPQGEIDAAIRLAEEGVTITTFGDLLKVPGRNTTLADVEGDVRMVQSIDKAVEIAKKVNNEVVFFAVGFETTAPSTASLLKRGAPDNFSIIPSHRYIPPAMRWLLSQGDANIDGFILPGHVSTIIGMRPYREFQVPQVIAGFEPLDILYGLYLVVKQIKEGRAEVENAYTRAVREEGNVLAQRIMNEVFHPSDSEWRGFPVIENSKMELNEEFRSFDAIERFGVEVRSVKKETGCICEKVLRGVAFPTDCKLFSKVCTPQRPVGPCMVSFEGACRIWYKYGERIRE
ncbi:MAG: hydrogenase formation protein HypD [Archaeoglobi archaeon]|nr:hydrogenase formation protein HypD [Candidatus Mnemosynella sp.]